MEDLIKAIYETLSTDPVLTSLVPAEQIRRGWNEPVEYPTVRFTLSDLSPIGDDMDSKEITRNALIINILADGDLELEPIADAVIDAVKAKSLIRDGFTIHACDYIGDDRGTYFDMLRKRHRKDLSFNILYSPVQG